MYRRAAQFIEKLRDGTVIDPRNLLKILPLLFEQAIALIFSELDYERNLKCNTAIAVRLLAIYSARIKDSKPRMSTATGNRKTNRKRSAEPAEVPLIDDGNVDPESLRDGTDWIRPRSA